MECSDAAGARRPNCSRPRLAETALRASSSRRHPPLRERSPLVRSRVLCGRTVPAAGLATGQASAAAMTNLPASRFDAADPAGALSHFEWNWPLAAPDSGGPCQKRRGARARRLAPPSGSAPRSRSAISMHSCRPPDGSGGRAPARAAVPVETADASGWQTPGAKRRRVQAAATTMAASRPRRLEGLLFGSGVVGARETRPAGSERASQSTGVLQRLS